MKVLLVNGSGRKNGNTKLALLEMCKVFEENNIETEVFDLGNEPIGDCMSCGYCFKNGECIQKDDLVNEFVAKAKKADGIVIGSPVYYAHPSGRIQSFLDRAFYSSGGCFRGKVGASVAVARRAGTSTTFDVLNKYFGISGMPVAGSTYWNIAHGRKPGEIAGDPEGLQTLRNTARNMVWMMQCFELGRQNGIDMPEMEHEAFTNFVR